VQYYHVPPSGAGLFRRYLELRREAGLHSSSPRWLDVVQSSSAVGLPAISSRAKDARSIQRSIG